jgi:predicted nucleic acid-binding protein
MAVDAVFLDTSVLVAASVAVHPGHANARDGSRALAAAGAALCISPQICREFLVVLTRKPVSGRTFSVEEALAALDEWRRGCSLLAEDEEPVAECLALSRKHQVKGKQIHDCNVVAVMRAHGVSRLVTRNPGDFSRYPGITVDAIRP